MSCAASPRAATSGCLDRLPRMRLRYVDLMTHDVASIFNPFGVLHERFLVRGSEPSEPSEMKRCGGE